VILVLLIGLVFVSVSFGLFVRTLLLPRQRRAQALQQIAGYGFAGDSVVPNGWDGRRPARLDLRRAVDGLAGVVGGVVSSRFKSMSEDNLKRLLRGAGFYTLPPRRFVGYQVLSTVTVTAIFLLPALTRSSKPLFSIMTVIIGLLAGWSLPLVYVKRRARMRGERIDYDMPDLIDTLVATVEAGIAFSASLQIASRRFRGPLGEELRLTLQEQNMGLGLNDSLNNMLDRQNTRSIRALVRSLIQGEQLGVSVGQTLRNLSHEMRTLRRQLAEERAQKAPVKLVFPVVLLILPALLLITLGPAVIRIHGIFH
jgi:tight adherence protein C